ncbi:MAG: anthranilate synthase component 1 [Sedimentisphaerales bacterium]
MTELNKKINEAKTGQIVPLVRKIDIAEPVEFFAKLSDYGRKQHCCLLESKDHLAGGSGDELTFGTANPALYVSGKGDEFQIVALSNVGKRMLKYFATAARDRFSFCEKINFGDARITGRLNLNHNVVDEQSRLKTTNQMDVIRAVNFAFELSGKPFRVTCGLLGAISYDFIDQFEKLPPNESALLDVPDYELYFADNIFLMDHKTGDAFVVVNAIITNGDREQIVNEAESCFDYYTEAMANNPSPRKYTGKLPAAETDTAQKDYEKMVETAKRHIIDGDIFQVVLSRTIIEPCPDEPLDVYKRLRKLNPSPYMFYINTPNTILTGASPELNLRVSGTENRQVEIRPIAGTKPRGKVDGILDPDTDFRYEAELKLDRKELAEHMMLVDLARNDIARVAKKGSRIVNELLVVEKYESVMHLVSNVKGILAEELDALSAYLATMNMGTLSGAPKIEAMKIIRQLEKNKRGYYGGAVMYLTVDGQFDSCITIRSLQIKDNAAYIRAGAGIVHDSVPATEFAETQHKAGSCLRAVRGN